MLAEEGYHPQPAGREVRLQPWALPDDASARQAAARFVLSVQTKFGEALLWEQVLEMARQALDIAAIGE